MKGKMEHVLRLPPGAGNPRNSEGDFLRLADGRWMFVYTHFYGGNDDYAPAYLAGRYSADEGATWTDSDVVILPNEAGMNVMSVSLLRLASGRAALFYLRKESTSDCRPYMRLLHEHVPPHEPDAWGPAIPIIPDERAGYYVMNNDRVIQLDSNRLIAPVAYHRTPTGEPLDPYGILQCYLSDDEGQTWYAGKPLAPARHKGHPVMLQEPGVVPLKDGRLMLFSRTDAGCQYLSYSQDGGVSWTPPKPSAIRSPLSPASIKRIPTTGDLLLVWNDHTDIPPGLRGLRTPLTLAISRDNGQHWRRWGHLETNPHGWYCYTAMAFTEYHVLLAYTAGDTRKDSGLSTLQLTRIPLESLYL